MITNSGAAQPVPACQYASNSRLLTLLFNIRKDSRARPNQPGEAVLGVGGDEVVALHLQESEEVVGDPAADGVGAAVAGVGVAAAITEPAGEGFLGAALQRRAEHARADIRDTRQLQQPL